MDEMQLAAAGTAGVSMDESADILIEDLEALRVSRPGTCGQNQY